MTTQIEELLERPVDVLLKMSYKDFEEELKHYFVVTRPDPNKKISHDKTPSGSSSKIARARAIAASMGIDLGFED